jgi:hypothetical protein
LVKWDGTSNRDERQATETKQQLGHRGYGKEDGKVGVHGKEGMGRRAWEGGHGKECMGRSVWERA